jgi:hypothetical protein
LTSDESNKEPELEPADTGKLIFETKISANQFGEDEVPMTVDRPDILEAQDDNEGTQYFHLNST